MARKRWQWRNSEREHLVGTWGQLREKPRNQKGPACSPNHSGQKSVAILVHNSFFYCFIFWLLCLIIIILIKCTVVILVNIITQVSRVHFCDTSLVRGTVCPAPTVTPSAPKWGLSKCQWLLLNRQYMYSVNPNTALFLILTIMSN